MQSYLALVILSTLEGVQRSELLVKKNQVTMPFVLPVFFVSSLGFSRILGACLSFIIFYEIYVGFRLFLWFFSSFLQHLCWPLFSCCCFFFTVLVVLFLRFAQNVIITKFRSRIVNRPPSIIIFCFHSVAWHSGVSLVG